MLTSVPLPVPLHLGALHPVEQLLVLLVAFGPFAVLLVVVAVVRRRDIAQERAEGGPGEPDGSGPGAQA